MTFLELAPSLSPTFRFPEAIFDQNRDWMVNWDQVSLFLLKPHPKVRSQKVIICMMTSY